MVFDANITAWRSPAQFLESFQRFSLGDGGSRLGCRFRRETVGDPIKRWPSRVSLRNGNHQSAFTVTDSRDLL